MKLNVESGEAYPYLFVYEPTEEYDHRSALEVPDNLGRAVLAARAQLDSAERSLLLWLRDEGVLPPQSNVLTQHLDEAGDGENDPDHH